MRAWLRTRLREQATWREVGFAAVSLAALWVIDLGVVSLAGWLPVMLMSAPLQPGMGVSRPCRWRSPGPRRCRSRRTR
ncbi:sensor domain-containing protein [Thermocatellispora tengchongensis]|uniref:sensor domain-containing protein n=1 Tax=Thermocatellispora tengchongensis TaxID=1073253 RepID=UPI00363649A0